MQNYDNTPSLTIGNLDSNSYCRKQFAKAYEAQSYCEGRVCKYKYNKGWSHTWRTMSTFFATKEAAMADLDASLISRGYVIIPDDQVERFTRKLLLLI